jgi:hypothetical protein
MSTVFVFTTNQGKLEKEYKPTVRLEPGTFVFVPKSPQGGLAIMAKIPKNIPGKKTKCCHGRIVGALDLGQVNRFDVNQVDREMQRLAESQGFVVTRLDPMCLTCHSTTIYSVRRRYPLNLGFKGAPNHVVAKPIEFRVCCQEESGGKSSSTWRRFLSLFPRRLWPLSVRT